MKKKSINVNPDVSLKYGKNESRSAINMNNEKKTNRPVKFEIFNGSNQNE